MKKPLCTFSLALLLASAPAAFAQTGATGGSGGTMSAGTRGSAGTDMTLQQRMGPDQRRLELVQTTLLNRFGGLGFHRIVDIRKQGANYVATVETVRGNNVALVIDPDTGQIVSEQPATAGTGTGAAGSYGATGGMSGGTRGGMSDGMPGNMSGGNMSSGSMSGGGMTGGMGVPGSRPDAMQGRMPNQ